MLTGLMAQLPETCQQSCPPGAHQLMVTRGGIGGKTTEVGVTVTIGGPLPIHVAADGSIQAAIDLAAEGDLIIVPPGTYSELLIVSKDVSIQGWGSFSTVIDGVKAPAEKLQQWRDNLQLVIGDPVLSPYLLNGQVGTFADGEGPPILVLGKNYKSFNGRIDGLTITGADVGGGVYVNGFTENLTISNNRIVNNQGNWGGGIRIGNVLVNGIVLDSQNDNMNIYHNKIVGNGSLSGAGGGIALYTGADGYEVIENYICGNFSLTDGGGIGHLGLSDNGLIADNKILFNEDFNQGQSVSGGAIFIGGLAPAVNEIVSPGSGSVVIDSNLIQGNLAGSGDGGAIRAQLVNGQDVEASPNTPDDWYRLDIFNNIIVNNVAGVAGAISLQDAANVQIIHNTIANNDSTATGSGAFAAGPSVSVPQSAGIVSRKHSGTTAPCTATSGLLCVIGTGAGRHFEVFSSPRLFNNIIWHNRSFYWDVNENGGIGGLLPDTPAYNDLEVKGTALPALLDPRYSILTDATPYDSSNFSVDPGFVNEYVNGAQGHLVLPEAGTGIQTAPAFDEGGTFIQARFGPLTPIGDYHLDASSTLIDAGCIPSPPGYDCTLPARASADFDHEARPDHYTPVKADIGADEYYDSLFPSLDVVGPITSGVVAAPNPTNGETTVTLTATASDVAT